MLLCRDATSYLYASLEVYTVSLITFLLLQKRTEKIYKNSSHRGIIVFGIGINQLHGFQIYPRGAMVKENV